MWEELRKEFQSMDPYSTGCVGRDEFRDVLIELCVSLSDAEINSLLQRFTLKDDRRVSQVLRFFFSSTSSAFGGCDPHVHSYIL